MPDVIQKGGVYDSDVWHPAVEECGVDVDDTTTFQAGSDTLVIINDQWLVEPAAGGHWRAREWLGREDEHYAAADEGEAVPE